MAAGEGSWGMWEGKAAVQLDKVIRCTAQVEDTLLLPESSFLSTCRIYRWKTLEIVISVKLVVGNI